MVLVCICTLLPSNCYVTWVENDTHFELQVLFCLPLILNCIKRCKKRKLIFPWYVFYSKSVLHSNGQQNFFQGKKKSLKGTSSHVMDPRCCFTHACKKQVLLSAQLSWWIIGLLAPGSPLLTQSCSPPLGPCTDLDCSDPDERKS